MKKAVIVAKRTLALSIVLVFALMLSGPIVVTAASLSGITFEDPENKPPTPERIAQSLWINEIRGSATTSDSQSDSIVFGSSSWVGSIWEVRYNGVNIRETPEGRSLGHVHAGDRAVHTGQMNWLNGYWWERVTMTSGQNNRVTGWIREDMLIHISW